MIVDGPVSPAVAGVEFLRAGQEDAARRLNTIVLNFYPPEKQPAEPGKPAPTPKILPPLTVEEALP